MSTPPPRTNKLPAADALRYALNDLPEYPRELQDLFYVPRGQAVTRFIGSLEDCAVAGKTFLVCGRAGTGKTTFLSRMLSGPTPAIAQVFQSSPRLRGFNYVVLHVDCLRDVVSKGTDISHFFAAVVAEYRAKLQRIYPLAALDTADSQRDKYSALCQHLADLTARGRLRHKIFLFVDDTDYCEVPLQKDLLDSLERLLALSSVVVVYACRPPALKEVERLVNRRPKCDLHHNSVTIDILPLGVRTVLAQRLAFLLLKRDRKRLHRRYDAAETPGRDAFITYIQREGPQVSDLAKIPYPLSPKQEYFIEQMSCGDIRLMLMLARRVLEHVVARRSHLIKVKPHGWHLGKAKLLELAGVPPRRNPAVGEDADKWKVLDLHEYRSIAARSSPERSNNSLYQNVLEGVAAFQSDPDDHFFAMLQELGHSAQDVRRGLNFLYWAGLIEELVIQTAGACLVPGASPREVRYVPTSKGNYYLHGLLHWSEYRERYGASARSLYDVIDTVLGCDPGRLDVLEFLACVCSRLPPGSHKHNYLFIDRMGLFEFFKRKYWERHARYSVDIDGREVLVDGFDMPSFENLVVHELRFANQEAAGSGQSFALKRAAIMAAAEKESSMCLRRKAAGGWQVPPRFTEAELDDFVGRYVEPRGG